MKTVYRYCRLPPLKLEKKVSSERIPSGIPALDVMLGGKGFFKGSSILVSGTAGTGKTSIAACLANESCNQKMRCLYFGFEESPNQIIRNMKSIGLNMQKHIDEWFIKISCLKAHPARARRTPTDFIAMHKLVRFKPGVVIVDPITNLITVGAVSEVKAMLVRLIDFLLEEQITVMFTALSLNTVVTEQTDEGVSSLVDTWISVKDIEFNGERNRGLYIIKSRGMKHSNQVREFIITDKGIDLVDVYLGPEGILTGSAREAQKLQEETQAALRESAISLKDREIDRKRKVLEARISSLQAEFESDEEELNKIHLQEELIKKIAESNRQKITGMRRG